MQSIPPHVTQAAWDGRLDCERNSRYFAVLADRYQRWHQWGTVGTVAVAIASVSVLIAAAPVIVGAALALATTIAAVSLTILNFGTTAAKADAASQHFAWLASDWAELWWQQSRDDVGQRISVLHARFHAVQGVGIVEDRRLNDNCHDEAIDIVTAEYQGHGQAA